MESNIVETIAVTGGTGIADFSVWGLFLRSDVVIKIVMIMVDHDHHVPDHDPGHVHRS